jgi:hypothetical protein
VACDMEISCSGRWNVYGHMLQEEAEMLEKVLRAV